ncbi:MAG: cytochrome c oxidase subunit II [Gemmatimonadota bacterium]|nr:cytochrome c oxidase subunit II [Gemmatimonadota bacterium]
MNWGDWSWMMPEGFSTFTAEVDSLYYLILWITGVTFFATEALLIYFIVRYRHKEGRKATYDHGSTKMEVVWTAIPLLILIGLGALSKGAWDRMKIDVPAGAMEIIVTAKQFEWNATYPGPDGALGTADDFDVLNQIHAPVDQPVWIHLRAEDVLHSLFLPEMRVKQDAVPGRDIPVWFEAMATGDYTIGCAELCGIGHTTMNGTLTIHSAADFQAWASARAEQRPQPQP